jgi:hypothetical protein
MNGPPLPEAAFFSSSSIPTGIPFVSKNPGISENVYLAAQVIRAMESK